MICIRKENGHVIDWFVTLYQRIDRGCLGSQPDEAQGQPRRGEALEPGGLEDRSLLIGTYIQGTVEST
jgi:hypothetical protein